MTPPPRGDRDPLGRRGEALARVHLEAAGYRTVAQNLRTRFAEIDLLMRHRRTLVAVEVKTRQGGAPERAVTAEQLARLDRAVRALAGTLRPRPAWLRIDVVAVVVGGADPESIVHLPGVPFAP